MGQILHGSATTTAAVRRAIQNSQASLRALANRYGINQKTVRKWRNRSSVPTSYRPEKTAVHSSVGRGRGGRRRIPPAYIAAARRLSLCPAGDHSASHALLAASLPATPRHQPVAGRRRRQARQEEVQGLSIGFFHIDIAEVRTEEGKLYLFVAIDRTSKFAFVQLEDAATAIPPTFLKALIEARSIQIRTVLTDNGVQFCDQPRAETDQRRASHAYVRQDLSRAGNRTSADQAEPSLDERPSRANEPNHQGGDRQTLPLRGP